MNPLTSCFNKTLTVSILGSLLCYTPLVTAQGSGLSIVPYLGVSFLGDQSPDISGAEDFATGQAEVSVDNGFTAGLSVRYDYEDSPWTSEFGWEYRTNDATTTSADNTQFPSGNYASNTFYLNGRYALTERNKFTPWVGGGLSWIQEIDLDSENANGERSFATNGSVGYQLMVGLDYNLSKRLYVTSEVRYTGYTNIDLDEEGNNGVVAGMDYQPITLGVGLGFRFR